MIVSLPFAQAARVPSPGDNVAIAIRRLEAGTEIVIEGTPFSLPHTILEGHRFAIVPIAKNQPLLSWGLPFGMATSDIVPGDYICNAKILDALAQRHVKFELPQKPNFRDHLIQYELNEETFQPGRQVPRHPGVRYFEGYARADGRGVGTRNFIVILGTSSRTAGYARALADRFKDVPARFRNIDGVVAVAHTEGGGLIQPNNFELVLRTLAGFVVNPNVSAFLAMDLGVEPVTNSALEGYLREHSYPNKSMPHRFLTAKGNYRDALAQGESMVRSWLEPVEACPRTIQSAEHLKIGLQCGGSDAFSGVSGNPLAGWVSKELIRYGGSANLAETDELMGAEPYVLRNVRDLETARRFLKTLERFRQRTAWHGHDAEGNPSGGNNFRGLYNIAIKSIGAARKKDPEVCLDYVIDYGEPMRDPGFYFMDSPGNDLESIAGQVASGCNIIVFTTGNGSITNFPFVPTIKIMTNTGRYLMLTKEMDVNAGRYQDGTPMDALGAETFELTLKIASGQKSVGEKAGHSQVQLWREWRQSDASRLETIRALPTPTGEPIAMQQLDHRQDISVEQHRIKAFRTARGPTSDRVGLIVPTSLCSGQIARMICDRLNQLNPDGLRYVALAHTEGCGVSGGDSEHLYLRTMTGYLAHPFVRKALLLEHGCEKTHNDALRNFLTGHEMDPSRFGWASVQMDGGIDAVAAKVIHWFQSGLSDNESCRDEVGLEVIRLGLVVNGPVPEAFAAACAEVVTTVVVAGGTVVIADGSVLLKSPQFVMSLGLPASTRPTLGYGEPFKKPGLHVMETPADHTIEALTGLSATGVELLLDHITDAPVQNHPLVPLLQVASSDSSAARSALDDLDLVYEVEGAVPKVLAEAIIGRIVQTASRDYVPRLFAAGNVDFQMTRGLLGVSL